MKLLSLKETAKKCGVSNRTIYRMIESGGSFPKPSKPYWRRPHFFERENDQWVEDATSQKTKSPYS